MQHYAPIRDRKIRIAVVGCGRISKNHFDSIDKHAADLELAAICDADPATLAAHSAKYRVPAFAGIDDALQSEKIDVVALCTPSGLHASQTLTAARHRINVVTEKPMATRWKDGVQMVKACDTAGVRLFVVKQNRHNATLQLLKRAVSQGASGAFTWSISMSSGPDLSRTMTRPSGAAPGSSTAARS